VVVFWDPADAGSLLDRLRGARQVRGKTFAETVWQQGASSMVVLELTGSDRAQAIEHALTVDRPSWVVLAGTAEAVTPDLKLDAVVLPTRLHTAAGESRRVQPLIREENRLPAGVVWGEVVADDPSDSVPPVTPAPQTSQRVVVAPALAPLIGVCDRRQVAWTVALGVRHNHQKPAVADVEAIRSQRHWAGKLGAATAAIWNRPRVAVDWFQQQQRQLASGDRLAEFLCGLLKE
jgi:hypothetical protein